LHRSHPARRRRKRFTYAQIPQDEYESLKAELEQLAPLRQQYEQWQEQAQTYQAEPGQQEGLQLPEGTLLAPQDVEFLRQQWLQDVAPVYDYTEKAQIGEAEERAMDIISDVAAQNDFELEKGEAEWIRSRAEAFVGEAQARHGQGPKAAEAAIQSAFNEFRGMIEARSQAALERQGNHIGALGNAPLQPSESQPAVQTLAAPYGGPAAVVQKYFPGAR
jgi:hypothetical protein